MKAESIAKGATPEKLATGVDYFDSIDRQGGGTTTISGVAVSGAPLYGPKGCIPILWCFCVHASPTNPCRCLGPIVWLPKGSQPHRQDALQRSAVAGGKHPILSFEIASDAIVYVDDTSIAGDDRGRSLFRRDAQGALSPVNEPIVVPRLTPLLAEDMVYAFELIEGDDRITAMAKKGGYGALSGLITAFKVGWAIGTAINDYFGLSDKISDWLINKFPPKPKT